MLADQGEQSRDAETAEFKLLDRVKDHVLQIESLVVYVILCVVTLYVLGFATSEGHFRILSWLVPLALLVGTRLVVRVTNPPSDIRDRTVWATTGAGLGGMIGGAVDLMFGGALLGQATMAGIGVGAAAGAALGRRIERRPLPEVLDRGDGFDYLYALHRKNPKVATEAQVNIALDSRIPFFDKNRDGGRWYTRDDLDKFLHTNTYDGPTAGNGEAGPSQ